jgi:2-polyprenylphenol 6-hydroxylase
MRDKRNARSGQQADIVIIGGGMVGSAAALSLGKLGYSVVVIEAGQATDFPGDEYDLRVSAISPASAHLLNELGAWDGILEHRVSPYERMAVWDASGSGSLSFDAADIGLPQLGHIVENRLINAALVEQVRSSALARYMTETRVTDISWLDDRVSIQLDNGDTLDCSLLVGADGGRSQVRKAAGLTTRGHAYHQTAIVANVRTEASHNRTAWQRFLPSGPLAFLPLSDGSCSIVWSADDPVAEELLALDPLAFEQQLEDAFESRLGKVKLTSKCAGFPLIYANAESYGAHRLVLVGDAAHRIHPLAGQGVNLGLGDVSALESVLAEARSADREAGDALYLRRYARARRADASAMMAGMDAIQHLFTSDNTGLQWARNAGLQLVDKTMPLKAFFMHQAAGERYGV